MHKLTRRECNYAEAVLACGTVVSTFRHNVSDLAEDGYITRVDGQVLDFQTRTDRAYAETVLREVMLTCGYRLEGR